MQNVIKSNGKSYVKDKEKNINGLEKGHILRSIKDGNFYTLQMFYSDGVTKIKKHLYFYFIHFIAHGQALKRLFETRQREGKTFFTIYKEITNKKEEENEKVFSIFETSN